MECVYFWIKLNTLGPGPGQGARTAGTGAGRGGAGAARGPRGRACRAQGPAGTADSSPGADRCSLGARFSAAADSTPSTAYPALPGRLLEGRPGWTA